VMPREGKGEGDAATATSGRSEGDTAHAHSRPPMPCGPSEFPEASARRAVANLDGPAERAWRLSPQGLSTQVVPPRACLSVIFYREYVDSVN
jgi:hypothetical protein